MITINGNQIPTPSAYNVSLQDLSKAERNARGLLIIERVRGGIRKLDLSWKYLTQEQLTQVLNAVSPVLFTVEFPDPVGGGMDTGTFYAGDRSVGALDFRNGVMRWVDIKFSLVER